MHSQHRSMCCTKSRSQYSIFEIIVRPLYIVQWLHGAAILGKKKKKKENDTTFCKARSLLRNIPHI